MPRTSERERCICSALRQATRHVTQIYDTALATTGLTITGYVLLARIGDADRAGINELAAAAVMDRSTLSRNLEPLRDAKLIDVRAGSDRRRKEVALTAKGRKALAAALPRWRAAQRNFKRQYGAGEADALTRLLARTLAVGDETNNTKIAAAMQSAPEATNATS